jgi:hypothetical protein
MARLDLFDGGLIALLAMDVALGFAALWMTLS